MDKILELLQEDYDAIEKYSYDRDDKRFFLERLNSDMRFAERLTGKRYVFENYKVVEKDADK